MTSEALAAAIDQFGDPRGYLAVASIGLPPQRSVDAMMADLEAWAAADRDPQGYDPVIERTRASYARLVRVSVDQVAIGGAVSVMSSLVAEAVPPGAEVLVADNDFSSVHFPFLQRQGEGGIRVRVVALDALADEIRDDTHLVAFSLVQSATGQVADVGAIREAAARVGALTYCDVTQAAGVYPVDASLFDITSCHAYKWLCSPRGVGFLTVSERGSRALRPLQAGWYAGDDVWKSTYGPEMHLATNARRFDVSPAWQAWVGAEHAIELFAGLDMREVWERTSGLGDALCEALGIPLQHQPIVTWPDTSGQDLRTLIAAGVRVSGRAGRLRASFHLWNDESDVQAVTQALWGS